MENKWKAEIFKMAPPNGSSPIDGLNIYFAHCLSKQHLLCE
jgi:hypothetical protein